jgi:hypothetical protein
MAEIPEEEVRIERIIACFAPGSAGAPQAVARLAREMQAELLGLFVEDVELLRFAALPFAAEVGFPSAAKRSMDVARLERQMRAQARALEEALAAILGPAPDGWRFRVERAAPHQAVAAALAEGYAPALLIPPRGDPHAERRVLRRRQLTDEVLRELLRAVRPVLILPE